MSLDGFKRTVIKRRTNGNVKLGNLLAKAIAGYEKSQVTKDWLVNYYKQLQAMEK